jgi:triosephosphate isomerase (TIM)
MAVSSQLGKGGLKPQKLEATATIIFERSVIAYEPVWATGTVVTATPETAAMLTGPSARRRREVSEQRRRVTSVSYAAAASSQKMSKSLMAQPGIDGLLVGGASLDSVSFASIVNL